MMYTNKTLSTNPHFKMKGTEFNEIVNSLKATKEDADKPVKIALTIRTATTNLVAENLSSIVMTIDPKPLDVNNYFSMLASIKDELSETFGSFDLDLIKQTVLMPIGVFEYKGQVYIYFNLIIQDNLIEKFNGVEFLKIEKLEVLDSLSKMVLPSLIVTK